LIDVSTRFATAKSVQILKLNFWQDDQYLAVIT
jgi:hypothetical protein